MFRTFAFIIALILISVEVFGATYWIAPTGRTRATDSETDPFGLIDNALKQVGGGNTFIFKPGTYLGRQVTLLRERAGTPQKPTVLKSQQKYEAIIHGSPGHGISVTDSFEWVIIDGFYTRPLETTPFKRPKSKVGQMAAREQSGTLHESNITTL